MENTQFETLMLAITGLDAKLSAKIDLQGESLRAEMKAGFMELTQRMDKMQIKLDATFDQLSRTAADVTDHEHRIRKLEGFDA